MASKILIIGGTGYIGKFIVEASAKSGHPTFALVRKTSVFHSEKGKLIESFKKAGVTLIYGDIYDRASLVEAFKQVDVVISSVGHERTADQAKIVAAIKEAGNIKRYLPSEFPKYVDRSNAVEPAKTAFNNKVSIIKEEGVPFTYVNSFAGDFLPFFLQPGAPPREKVFIPGDGNVKAVFNAEEDIGAYIIKAVDDERTLNKILYIRPETNILTFNELVSIWEKKIGKELERIYVPEEQLLKNIQEAPAPRNFLLAFFNSLFHSNVDTEPSFGLEASELYPDVKNTTADEYLNRFL